MGKDYEWNIMSEDWNIPSGLFWEIPFPLFFPKTFVKSLVYYLFIYYLEQTPQFTRITSEQRKMGKKNKCRLT